MTNDGDEIKGNVDYLVKYRGRESEQVANAQYLTFVPTHAEEIDGKPFTHLSLPYALLRKIAYFDGRMNEMSATASPKPNQQKEIIQLDYATGEQVSITGFYLEPLHRRITRCEVDTIRAVYIETDEELEAVRNDKQCIVDFLFIVPGDSDRHPSDGMHEEPLETTTPAS